MNKKNSSEKEGNGRSKILETAAEVFAEKGFDGARVDEIAKKAGVNKALIYYYFESKDKILEELFKNYIDETIKKKHDYMNQVNTFDSYQLESYVDKNLSLVKESGGEIFKIAIGEALKNNKQDNALFKMMDMFMKDLIPLWNEKGVKISSEVTDALLIPAFFFGFAPVMFYITLGEKWAEYYNIDKEVLHKRFVSTLNATYVKDLVEPLLKNKK
jgi:AcrR family transcriptional regulator